MLDAMSDASGWDDFANYSTIRMPDLDGDGDREVCARANAGIRCWSWDGEGFRASPIVGPELSDAEGWGHAAHYRTIRFADVDGDGDDDLCARAYSRLWCWASEGESFGARIDGPAWSNAAGWIDPRYHATIRVASRRARREPPAPDAGAPGDDDASVAGSDATRRWSSPTRASPRRATPAARPRSAAAARAAPVGRPAREAARRSRSSPRSCPSWCERVAAGRTGEVGPKSVRFLVESRRIGALRSRRAPRRRHGLSSRRARERLRRRRREVRVSRGHHRRAGPGRRLRGRRAGRLSRRARAGRAAALRAGGRRGRRRGHDRRDERAAARLRRAPRARRAPGQREAGSRRGDRARGRRLPRVAHRRHHHHPRARARLRSRHGGRCRRSATCSRAAWTCRT
ncbi:MAG: FG-GAP-like repeat-containing protein [Sandaracinaceae bacterium]|nr:FG-GAP-like repeat-containing protein [Sandaracinaceae bacterium]